MIFEQAVMIYRCGLFFKSLLIFLMSLNRKDPFMKKYILFSLVCMVSVGMTLMGMEQQMLKQLKNQREKLSIRFEQLNDAYDHYSYASTVGEYEAIVQERERAEEKYEVREQLDGIAQQIEMLQQRLQRNDYKQP